MQTGGARQDRLVRFCRAPWRVGCFLVVCLAASGTRASAAESSDEGTLVDSGVALLESCALSDLAFRTPSDAWLSDDCGGLFRSGDGGHHWTALDRKAMPRALLPFDDIRGAVERIEWLDERIGILFAWDSIVRSADGGLTWQRQMPEGVEGPWRIARAANTFWLCDRGDRIFRSDDAGASWHRMADAPAAHGCSDLSFADRDHGWLSSASEHGGLWQTNDGGTTWSALPAPPDTGSPELLRLSRDIGWLYDVKGPPPKGTPIVYRTNDGGRHWSLVPAPDPAAATVSHLLVDGQLHELTAGAPIRSLSDLEHVTPLAWRSQVAIVDERTAVRAEDEVIFYRDGQRTGATPLLSPPSGVTERLVGILGPSPGRSRWAWTALHTYRMDDPQVGWFVVAYHPERFARVILASESSALARGRSGALYQSTAWLDGWSKTTDPLLRWQWARRTGHVRPSPVACMPAAERGSVSLEIVEFGCYHHRERGLTVAWNGDGGGLRLSADKIKPPPPLALSPDDARALVSRIAEVLERYDPPSSCASTSVVKAEVRWQCNGSKEQQVTLWAPECGAHDVGTVTGQTSATAPMRADLLLRLVRDYSSAPAPATTPPAK